MAGQEIVILVNKIKEFILCDQRTVDHLRSICVKPLHKYVLDVALDEDINPAELEKQQQIVQLLNEFFWPHREDIYRGKYPPLAVELGLDKVITDSNFRKIVQISKRILDILVRFNPQPTPWTPLQAQVQVSER
jgi:hypothetical protein